jgi:hypothetical protein
VRAGAVDLLKDALRLVPGASVEIKVELAVSSPALWKKISGRTIGVMAEGGRPASIAMSGPVKVFAAVQPDGAFEFSRVVPGSYAIDVFPIPDSLEGAFRVGVLLVGDTDLANIDIPASLFAFTVSGRAPGEAELKQSGVLGNGDSIRAFLVDQSRMRSLFSSPATTPQPGFRVRTASSGPAGPGGAVAATPSSRLGPDGEFQFKNVFPGDYRLTFSVARAGSDVIGVNTSGGTPVTVVDKDIDGLVVPVDLSGAPPAPPPPPR